MKIKNQKSKIKNEIAVAAACTLAAILIGSLIMGVARGTVPTTSDIERYACDGSTTAFTFHFGAWATSEVLVRIVDDSNDVPTTLTEASDYTVSLPNDDGWLVPGGTVTTTETWAAGYTIVLSRLPPMGQDTPYSTATELELATVEDDFDKSVVRDQYLQRQIRRSLRTDDTDTTDFNLPAAAARANGYLAFDANGAPNVQAGTLDPNTIVVRPFWEVLLGTYNLAQAVAALGTDLEIAVEIGSDAAVDAAWWDPNGNGVVDDTNALQDAIDYAVSHHRKLIIRRPSVAYRITDSLQIGTGTAVSYGIQIEGVGLPKILYDGDANGTVLAIVSVAESEIRGLWIDGNDVNGVTGVHVYCEPTFAGQRLTLRGMMVQNCPLYGVRLVQDANATCDYVAFDMTDLSDNGINLRIEGDIRQVDYRGGSLLTAGTYAVDVNSGWFNGTDCLFGRSGTADILLGSNTAGVSLHTSKHESNEVLVTEDDAATYSPGTPPITLINVCQDLYELPFTGETAIQYNAYKSLVMVGCKFVGDVNVGTSALGVVSINTEFIPSAYSGIDGAFTGETDKVTQIGDGVVGTAGLYTPGLQVVHAPPWPDGLSVREVEDVNRYLIFFSHGEPNHGDANSYYRVGARGYNAEPYVGRPGGWACIQSGSLDGNTPALWTPMAPVGWLWGSLTWDPASLNNGVGETSGAVTVKGAALGDAVLVCPPCSLASLLCTGWVSDANEVQIRVYNATGGAVDIAGGEWKVRVVKPPSE